MPQRFQHMAFLLSFPRCSFFPSGSAEFFLHPAFGIVQVVPAEVLVVIEAQEVHLVGQLGQGLQEAFPVPGQDFADDEPVAVDGVFKFPLKADGDVLPLEKGVRQVVLQVDIGIAAVQRRGYCQVEPVLLFHGDASFTLPCKNRIKEFTLQFCPFLRRFIISLKN